ncbi:hypothetical protein GGI43DRAFT_414421 [Trichoderma evansii]
MSFDFLCNNLSSPFLHQPTTMAQSPLPAKLNLQGTRSYPPCLFNTQAEKDLYKRLRDVYEEHCHTWDAEARNAWPVLVEHASLAPSTIGKTTNHYITRHMTSHGATWAHVVALRIIYDKQLYKSKKLMRCIRDKYPNASFESFGYSEDYTLTFKSENAREAQIPTVQESPAIDGSAQRRQNDGGLQPTEMPPNNYRAMSRGATEFLNEGNASEDEPLMWNSSKRKKQRLVQQSAPRKRTTTNNERTEGEVEPGDRRIKRPNHAVRDASDVSPRSTKIREGPAKEQDGSMDVFNQFMSAIKENTRAAMENKRATEENTRVTEENTKAIKGARGRNKVASKKATTNQIG